MELIVVILLLIAMWIVYKIYVSYNDIVKELRQIRNKCVKEGAVESMKSNISESYTNDGVVEVRDGLLSALKGAIRNTQ